MIVVLISLGPVIMPASALTTESGWQFYRTITVSNPGAALSAFQLEVKLDSAALIAAGKMRGDCGDVRFTESTDPTELSHWLEKGCGTASTSFWVRVPNIPSGTSSLRVYYGNPAAASAASLASTFDPATFSTFAASWRYSGTTLNGIPGWEAPLTSFGYDDSGWSSVTISTDYVPGGDYHRWFVRKELFLHAGTVSYSGVADDDEVWTLVSSSGGFSRIGGNENDVDGGNAGVWSGRSFAIPSEGRYVWAGRGHDGAGGETLEITSIDGGMDRIYLRKTAASPPSVSVGAEIALPGPPESLTATPGPRVGEVTLSWQPPSGGVVVAAYRIYRGDAGDTKRFLAETDGVRTYVDRTCVGLCSYQVTAVNERGEGPRSNEAFALGAQRPDPCGPGLAGPGDPACFPAETLCREDAPICLRPRTQRSDDGSTAVYNDRNGDDDLDPGEGLLTVP